MPDPITTLGLAKSTSDIIREAMQFAREAKNADLAEKLLDVYSDLLQLSETNQILCKEIQSLKEQADIARFLRFNDEQGSYTLERDGKQEGPFCGTCWDIDHRLVRMTKGGLASWFCDWCSNRRPRRD